MSSGHDRPQFSQPLTSIEICAGAGGQAVGLHHAGFDHSALVEWDTHAVTTLRANVGDWPGWSPEKAQQIHPMDVRKFLGSDLEKSLNLKPGDLDLLAGGVPCPPFSLAGKRLGEDDERDLFPAALEIIEELLPKAVMIENVRGILEPPEFFIDYRIKILNRLRKAGYAVPKINSNDSPKAQDIAMRKVWRRLDAKNYGVPQLRPRAILVAIHKNALDKSPHDFEWPAYLRADEATVFSHLRETMRERLEKYWDLNKDGKPAKPGERTGQNVYDDWYDAAEKAASAGRGVAPTLVGGSKKHGGADLGPTRAKRAWATMNVDAMGVANDPKECNPERDLFRPVGPMLTVEQAAIIQGFPREWDFRGGKTARYRQVGNAFPPPVAEAVGRAIAAVLRPEYRTKLLAKYAMESSDTVRLETSDPSAEQMEISVSTRPARQNRVSDLASTSA
ncbi:DNA cytosine methyltransferase [Streptomyces fuscichromogenes]|uniref:Cytosine-specific methyltransferase n=1 Tax=Streptomyces fuscichromogenes TaxID=1324013 RepID=A0A917UJ13_9ACTN|nr:DNA (cytosine-5-)-methyltransferase [Streptomyces fuscichromogenes]GGM90946.1 DNA cytosine methyltransferase [Streptomyces fuscichromogenes]